MGTSGDFDSHRSGGYACE